MSKSRFSLNYELEAMKGLVSTIDHQTLGIWAKECAGRVLPHFVERFPGDPRPQRALDALQQWIETGKFSMADIRKASLDSHAAARDVGDDSPARSAARAAGQAVATAHVPTHSIGAANYVLQAIHRAREGDQADAAVASERAWQLEKLTELNTAASSGE